jgi:calcium/calmodulin-dependent protein kinase I
MKCGSPGYVAPEILNSPEYDCKSDLFSAGIILYIMLTGKFVFYGENYKEILVRNKECEVPYPSSLWENRSKEVKTFLRDVLTKDPQVRLSAKEALNHPWIKMFENHIIQYTLNKV